MFFFKKREEENKRQAELEKRLRKLIVENADIEVIPERAAPHQEGALFTYADDGRMPWLFF